MPSQGKKTVLYLITQTEYGGAQCYVYDLVKSLKDEFKIIVAGGEQGKNGEIAEKIIDARIEFIDLKHLKRAISPINDFLSLIEIIKLIKKIKPDIIHLNSSKISILGSLSAFFCKLLNIKCYIIYTAHGWVFNEPLPPWLKNFYYYSEKITAKLKNKIICVSEFDRQTALKVKIAPKNKLITIHNGIDRVDFLPRDEAQSILSKKSNILNTKSEIIIGSIGNFYKTKGYEYLITALEKINKNNIKFKSIIIGVSGPEKNNIIKLIKEKKLENIIAIASLNNASIYLKAFDIYICSSVKEGLSYTIIEAMQAGLPIIATNVGGNSELIQDNKNGLIIKAERPEQISDSLQKLIDNETLRKILGQEARKSSDNFTLDKMVAETKKLYY